jgi:hypothetical protein
VRGSAVVNAAGLALKPTPDVNGVQTADTVKYWINNPITPPPYAVYEQETYNPARQTTSKWRLTSFVDGQFALQHFDETGLKVTHTVIWDGKYRRVVNFRVHTVMSYLMYPNWGAQQMTVLVKQAATRELKDATPDPSLLVIPNDYEEHTPSEVAHSLATATGIPLLPCEAGGLLRADAAYFTYQVETPFAIERIIQTVGNPRILYKVFETGVIVRSDFRGTDVKVTVLNPLRMERVVLDTVGKSMSTYPWDQTDTAAWKELVHIADNLKSTTHVDPAEGVPYATTPEGFTERSPSDTYVHYVGLVGQKPDEQYLAFLKSRDAIYRQGQEELAKRGASCTNPAANSKPAAQPKD